MFLDGFPYLNSILNTRAFFSFPDNKMAYHPPAHLNVQPTEQQKIQIAGADWCGYTKKFKKAVESSPHAAKFEYVDCAKESNKQHDVCVGVSGFPTMKKNGAVCAVGHQTVNEALKKCS